MHVISVSDFHLGKGKFLENGQLNILEDFDEDEQFSEFLNHYSSGKFHKQEVTLVLNGDIFNLIQIDIYGVFTHAITEEVTVKALERVAQGHPAFFEALKAFINTPNKKILYMVGNHDAGMDFSKAQEKLCELIEGSIEFAFSKEINGIYIEHGHRFEVINAVPRTKYYLQGPYKQKILNLPWGSLFCIFLLPKLKKERPFLDKVRPMASYIKWLFFHDSLFFVSLVVTVCKYIVRTRSYIKYNRNFRTTLKLLKQITIYPRYEKKAKRIFARKPHIHTVIMGHTHIPEWRKFPEGKLYFNTGTWNTIPTIDTGRHKSQSKLTYISIELNPKTKVLVNACMNTWIGKWRPYKEEVTLTGQMSPGH